MPSKTLKDFEGQQTSIIVRSVGGARGDRSDYWVWVSGTLRKAALDPSAWGRLWAAEWELADLNYRNNPNHLFGHRMLRGDMVPGRFNFQPIRMQVAFVPLSPDDAEKLCERPAPARHSLRGMPEHLGQGGPLHAWERCRARQALA